MRKAAWFDRLDDWLIELTQRPLDAVQGHPSAIIRLCGVVAYVPWMVLLMPFLFVTTMVFVCCDAWRDLSEPKDK